MSLPCNGCPSLRGQKIFGGFGGQKADFLEKMTQTAPAAVDTAPGTFTDTTTHTVGHFLQAYDRYMTVTNRYKPLHDRGWTIYLLGRAGEEVVGGLSIYCQSQLNSNR